MFAMFQKSCVQAVALPILRLIFFVSYSFVLIQDIDRLISTRQVQDERDFPVRQQSSLRK